MSSRKSQPPEDELARRRGKRLDGAALRASEPGQDEASDEEPIRLSRSDTLALIIAAYQVLFPILLVMMVAMGGVYFLFMLLAR